MMSQRFPRRHRPQAYDGRPRTFPRFTRLPVELRLLVWEFASNGHGCLQVVTWQGTNMFVATNHKCYGDFHNPAGYRSLEKERPSPLMLVNRESHAVATAVKLHTFVKRNPVLPSYQLQFPRPVSYTDDMFYFPCAPKLSSLLSTIIKEPFANKLEKVAVHVFGRPCLDDGYVSGQQFEDAIKSLPKLRQLFLVVDRLFSANFGPGRVPRRFLPCPNHVFSRTALEKHIKSQGDCGFGFSSYKEFTKRWQQPIVTAQGGGFPEEHVAFEDYNAYCYRLVDRARQIADKLGRHIDVKLRVDLDAGPLRESYPYTRTNMHLMDPACGSWYSMFSRH